MRIEIIRKGKIEQTYTFLPLVTEEDSKHVIARILQLAYVMDACTINLVSEPEKDEQKAVAEIFRFFPDSAESQFSSLLPKGTTLAFDDNTTGKNTIAGKNSDFLFSVRKSLYNISINKWMEQKDKDKAALSSFIYCAHKYRTSMQSIKNIVAGAYVFVIFTLAALSFLAGPVIGAIVMSALALTAGLLLLGYGIYNLKKRAHARNEIIKLSDQAISEGGYGFNKELRNSTARVKCALSPCELKVCDDVPGEHHVFGSDIGVDAALEYIKEGDRLFYVNRRAVERVVELTTEATAGFSKQLTLFAQRKNVRTGEAQQLTYAELQELEKITGLAPWQANISNS